MNRKNYAYLFQVKKFSAKIGILFVFFSVFSCNSVKKVPENQYLLRKNTLLENNKKPKDTNASDYILQKPNGRLLGIPLGLFIYNWAKENPEQDYWAWLEKHPKTHNTLKKILSEKQVNRLGKSFLVSGKDRMFKDIGEAPVILDTAQTNKTTNTLRAYYRSNGYFNATSEYEISAIANKKQQALVTYRVETGKPYFIDSLLSRITSPELDSVYQAHIGKQIIKKGQQYSLTKFAKERERLNTLFRNQGFYNFQQSAINFEIERDTLVENDDQGINVRTEIGQYTDRSGETPQQKPYTIHKIGKINLFTDSGFSNENVKYDTIQYKDLTIHYQGKLHFRRKMLYNAIALRSGNVYRDEDRASTYRQISNLRTFKYPTIQYIYSPTDSLQRTLDANVYLTPLSRYSTNLNTELTHSDIQTFGIGGSASVQARNLFRGAEMLEIGFRGTIGSQANIQDDTRFFNVLEYGGDLRLIIPRTWFFLNTDKIIPHSMTPQTTVQFSLTDQKNIGLDRNKLQGILRYSWNPTLKNHAILELLDIEFVKNKNPQNFFRAYRSSYEHLNQIAKNYNLGSPYMDANNNLDIDTGVVNFLKDVSDRKITLTNEEYLQIFNVAERYVRLTRNDLIMATSFTYIFNNSIRYYDPNFKQFRVKLETAGNLPQLFSKVLNTETDNEGQRQFFGVTYAQYIKTEMEYIKHWPVGEQSMLAFRTFAGIAIPYGNGKNIPFSRSYFAGGSNDNRGWRAYSLGPGSSKSFLDYNEANFKFTTNLEYRFPIMGALKGAFFVDAGNIWNVFDQTKDTEWQFDKLSDIQDIAISTGLGIRYDFNYFVLRLDLGVKTYDPSKNMGSRWIRDFNLSDYVINIGINYPF